MTPVRSIYDLEAPHSEPEAPEHTDKPEAGGVPESLPDFVMPGGYLPPHVIVRSRKPADIIPGVCFESSVGLLVAPPYVGKTLLMIDLALALATNERWLKWQPVRAVPSIVFALDSPGWESREQAECLMAGRGMTPASQPFFLVTREEAKRMWPCDGAGDRISGALKLRQFNILDDAWFDHICAVALGAGARFIGLDSLSKIHNADDENARKDMEPVMEQLAKLASITRAHVMCAHHTPVVERGGVYAGRGSSVIAASVDFEAQIIKTSRTECHVEILKGRGSDDDAAFDIAKERVAHPTCARAVRWAVLPPKEDKPKAADVAWEWIAEALSAGPLTRSELTIAAIDCGFDQPGGHKLDNYLVAFKNAGLIHSPARGTYELTTRGKKRA